MRVLGRNTAFLLKSIAKNSQELPKKEDKIMTHFIR